MIPEGIKVYGPGKQKFKPGDKIPKHLGDKLPGRIEAAGKKFQDRKPKEKAKDVKAKQPASNHFGNSVQGGNSPQGKPGENK